MKSAAKDLRREAQRASRSITVCDRGGCEPPHRLLWQRESTPHSTRDKYISRKVPAGFWTCPCARNGQGS